MKKAARKKAKESQRSRRGAQTGSPTQAQLVSEAGSRNEPLAIVGIGASAGGLEAFTQLLQALPPDTGMAFVYVQHLEAKHESMLTRLLSSATKMPIAEVKQGARVQPNNVYVIPPNADIRVVSGVLQSVRRRAPKGFHLPIDHFFRSLAEDQGARAVGVILSGTASDGTLGLKAIKVEGGITFAQDPESAKFDGMPSNAIAAGCVDFVLRPERIAAELGQLSRHPYVGVNPPGEAVAHLPARDDDWLRVFKLLSQTSGVDFTFYKKPTIKRRIARRMAVHKIENLRGYVNYLESHREERDALYQDILIHVTTFFREPEVFRVFQSKIVPRILAGKPSGEPCRMWIAGCSTGEEAYSLAICMLENLSDRAAGKPVQIFGTDVSEEAIEKTRVGIYPADALTNVAPDRLRRFFTKVNGQHQIKSAVRDLCVFARHDLTKDPPFSKLDLISCRNVLIYLEPVLQKKILASFHYALKDTGFLLLGKSETLGGFPDLFTPVDRKNKFFAKKTSVKGGYEVEAAAFERIVPREKRPPEEHPSYDLEREADRLVWDRYSHAGLVVNNDLQILHFRGDTSAYLRPAPGKATFHLLRMLRDELVFVLRASIHAARRSGETVRRDGVHIKQNGTDRNVSIEVRPLPGPGNEKFFLILFDELGRAEEPPAEAHIRPKKQDREVLRLQTELARTKEYLQTVIQEQESTNEELKTANEEALSSMEELQSANEELETAKEELQSSNEELVTLNEQLQNRNTELGHLTDDLSNVLSGLNIPIVMLDQDRRIRRFTPSAEKLLHLLAGDIGRPLDDIRLGINIPDLDDLIASVMDVGLDAQREVRGNNGAWYSLRLCPYRARDRAIKGVLIALLDVTELKQSQEALRAETSLTSAILEAAAGSLLVAVFDPEGRILRFNHACQETSGYSEDEVRGRRIWEFLVPPEETAAVKAAFRNIRQDGPGQHQRQWLTKRGTRRLIDWSTSFTSNNDTIEYVIGIGIDITERQALKEEALEKQATVQALLQAAAQAILAYDDTGRIKLANPAAEAMFGYSGSELLNLNVGVLLPNPHVRRGRRAEDWTPPWDSRETAAGAEFTGRRKDGTEFPLSASFSYVQTKDGQMNVSFILDISERIKSESSLLKYQQELRQLAGRLLSIQENETRLLARDLHDDLSQKLAALSMEASALAKSDGDAESVKEKLRDLWYRIGTLSDDVHRISRRLHPAILDDLGLEAGLREECLNFSKASGTPVQFQAEHVPRSMRPEISLCLFRVAQEALRNIDKHAGAREVHMVLARHESDLVLLIEDNGSGFQVEQARGKGGLGLISMEERVRLVNGEFSIRSQPGKSTEIEVRVPVGAEVS